ncbi:hypothetical protein ILUMI_17095 [Ignelater luminosus]|uniref:Endonuclease/exonuclease/phosphatase domain-containing protein n=1 Tax=Ignelater luminosus TaxID=2038154 RepID=A0A8K0G891_IGNLU|nr:hypothetical protein ILUMI_17095 [Ignelater luminosus]
MGLTIGENQINILNIYRPANNEILPFLDELQTALNMVNESKLIVGDFNCRSVLWFDRTTDAFALHLEEFILNNELAIFNEDNSPPTFQTKYGNSHIDLTLATNLYKLGKHKTDPNRPQWWTYRSVEHIWQKRNYYTYNNRILEDRDYPYQKMISEKERYKNCMNEAQNKSWVHFVEDDLMKNPWGVVYKLATLEF